MAIINLMAKRHEPLPLTEWGEALQHLLDNPRQGAPDSLRSLAKKLAPEKDENMRRTLRRYMTGQRVPGADTIEAIEVALLLKPGTLLLTEADRERARVARFAAQNRSLKDKIERLEREAAARAKGD